MTQSLYTPWDSHSATAAPASYSVYSDYLALDHHYPAATDDDHVPHDSRPCSSSSAHSFTSPRQPRFENASWDAGDLYQYPVNEPFDSPLTSPEPDSASEPAPASVKQEDTQDDFVFETPAVSDAATSAYPAFSSMTEVPLRATQATKEMRVLMGVFRLDPFTMHNAQRDPNANVNWNGEPIGPLRHDPVLLEFQLEITSDRVKSEPPAAAYPAADASDSSARKRRRTSPMYAADRSLSPALAYTLAESPSSSPIDSSSHAWSGSESHSLGYSSELLRHHSAYDTVLTPAQGLDASLELGYSSRYASATSASTSSSLRMPSSVSSLSSITKQPSRPSSLHHASLSYGTTESPPLSYVAPSPPMPSSSPSFIHPSSSTSSSSSMYGSSMSSSYASSNYAGSHHMPTRQSLAYTTSSPVRLPPPQTRYAMQSDLGVIGHDVNAAHSIDVGSGGVWRKSASLGMVYGSGKDASGSHSSPGHSGQGLSLAQPQAVGSIASRRLGSAGVGISGYGGVTRSGRVGWA
ncbi:hypothetical protein PsYK624_127330 [Phanerochaete sordida]|uniref:Uncharacterized protein n=1 Tax=Phanerochaete sordida TaxID=48140 RepID=A0A9P3LIH2_9APHY|nr:hypothetical protein PsYK624_127330 [Phanerochaete sordida]